MAVKIKTKIPILMSPTEQELLQFGYNVFDIETRAIQAVKSQLGDNFVQACRQLLDCKGRIIAVGLGKSGHVARKIASTFASTGSPAFFIHAAEANHGDSGMITHNDVVVAISNSGETAELINMLPLIKRLAIPLIVLSGVANSALAKAATVYLEVGVQEEACPLGLAPTSSTTATLVMGDALAITLLQARGFTADDFALYHPGGQLGRRLSLRVSDVMRVGKSIPKVYEDAKLHDVLIEMTQKSLGFTTVVNRENQLLGVYTDGDVRRSLNHGVDVYTTTVREIMVANPKTISADKLAAEALHLMELYKITGLCVICDDKQLAGVVHIHDLLSAGLA
jgi:arabinose-5-phosphate isomerase